MDASAISTSTVWQYWTIVKGLHARKSRVENTPRDMWGSKASPHIYMAFLRCVSGYVVGEPAVPKIPFHIAGMCSFCLPVH